MSHESDIGKIDIRVSTQNNPDPLENAPDIPPAVELDQKTREQLAEELAKVAPDFTKEEIQEELDKVRKSGQ